MKRFLISTTFVLVFAGMALAKGPGGQGNGNGQGNGQSNGGSRTFTRSGSNSVASTQGQAKKTTGTSQNFTKQLGSSGQNQFAIFIEPDASQLESNSPNRSSCC